MALINCSECGREISDRAISCPHCGCPVEEKHAFATLKIQREAKTLFCAVKYEIWLDYEKLCVLGNGESTSEYVACGEHHLEILDKNNFNRSVYNQDVYVSEEGLSLSFEAAVNPTVYQSTFGARNSKSNGVPVLSKYQMPQYNNVCGGRTCPKCGGVMTIQTVSESRKAGCFVVLLYILLALTIFGLLIVIPLLLRKKTETITYAVCQQCGYRRRI